MKFNYVSPEIEIVSVSVEKGFAASTGGTTGGGAWGAPMIDDTIIDLIEEE